MTDATNPAENPALAAQEALLALIQAGKTAAIHGESDGENLAKGLIQLHEKLTAYYRTLPEAQ